jgi:hypothetical protein
MKNVLVVLITLMIAGPPAWAALGQYEGSVSVDREALKSEDHVQNFQGYKVHQLTTATGLSVREFVSPQGRVFGVSWGGRFRPDLNQLLGSYVINLQTATPAQTQVRHLRGLTVKTSDFVFTNFGTPRISTGSAYVPSLVPVNVSAGVVR